MCSHTRTCMRVHMAMGARVCICVCVWKRMHTCGCVPKIAKKVKGTKFYWCVLSEFPILFFIFLK